MGIGIEFSRFNGLVAPNWKPLKRLTNIPGDTLHRAEAAVLMRILDAFALWFRFVFID